MNLGLALRLTLRGDRVGGVRLLLMASGVALAVALLLAVAGALPAHTAGQDVVGSRSHTYDEAADPGRTEGVTAGTSTGLWRGRELRSLRFTLVGPPVAPPVGVTRLPGPDEVIASPALIEALSGPHGEELAPRLPGRVVGTVSAEGLTGPDELYYVSPTTPGTHKLGDLGAGFKTLEDAQGADASVDDELLIAVPLAGVGLVVPLLVLVGTSTRLSAATRERRAAAMRLVGATARQVTALAAVEGAVVGAFGAVFGGVLFLLLRGPVAALLPLDDGLYTARVAPPPSAALLVLVGVPLLGALIGPLALRRVVTSPLGVTRRSRAPRAGLLRLVPLGMGICLLLLTYANRAALLSGERFALVLLVSGAGLCLIGLAIAGAALARAGGLALHRWGPGPASQLAGQRLVLDPASAARTVTGTALVVVVTGWLLAFLPLLAQAQSGHLDDPAAHLRPGTLVAGLDARQPVVDIAALGELNGVDAVVRVAAVSMLREGAVPLPDESEGPVRDDERDHPLPGVVADCAELALVLRAPLPGCRPGEVQLISRGSSGAIADADLSGELRLLDSSGEPVPGATVDVPAGASVVTIAGDLGGISGVSIQGAVLLPPTILNRPDLLSRHGLLVATDGSANTIEAVRAALGPTTTYEAPMTVEEAAQQARSSTDLYSHAALIGVVAVVLVGGLTLAVSTADGLRERRLARAALVALGTPLRVLRRSVLLQMTVPLLLCVGTAVLVAAAGSAIYLRLDVQAENVLPLPWAGYAAISLTAVLASLLATAVTLPLIRAAGRPEALRAE